jgi:hypothetical protein
MKPPPDEKAVETLRAATQGRKARGKWRFVAVILIITALLLGGTFAVVDLSRQSALNAAQTEADEEARAVRVEFAHVQDWGKWYRSRLPENCGGDNFEAWVAQYEPISDAYPDTIIWEIAISDVLTDPASAEIPVPGDAALKRYLADTQAYADSLRELLEFECLSPPVLHGESLGIKIIPRLSAFGLLRLRILTLFYLGSTDAAWCELATCLKCSMKFDKPGLVLDHMVALGTELAFHDLIEKLIRFSAPPRPVLEDWRELPAISPSIESMLVESELAWLAQVTEERTDWIEFEKYDGEENPGRFGYLDPTLDWDDRKKAFSGPIETTQYYARYIHDMRMLAEHLQGGGTLRDWSHVSFYWQRCAGCSFRIERLREQTELLASIRLAEPDFEADGSGMLADLGSRFTYYEVASDADGWKVSLRARPDVISTLNLEEDEETPFSERHPPVYLKRIK